MALTKEDLYAIGELLEIKLKAELQPVKEKIQGMNENVSALKEEVSVLKEEVSVLKEEVSVLKKEVSVLKEEVSALKEEVSVLKKEVSVLKEEVSSLKERTRNLEEGQHKLYLLIENEICSKINILVENYVPAAQRYQESMEQLGNMQSDIIIVKKVVASHSEKFQMLGV